MDLNMRGNTLRVRNKVEANMFGQTVVFMMVNGKIT